MANALGTLRDVARRWRTRALICCCVILVGNWGTGWSQRASDEWTLESAQTALDELEEVDLEADLSRESLSAFEERITEIASGAEACRERMQEQIDRYRSLQASPPAEGEDSQPEQIKPLTERLNACQFVLSRTQGLRESVTAAEVRLQSKKLFARHLPVPSVLPTIGEAWADYGPRIGSWFRSITSQTGPWLWAIALLAGAVGAAVGWWFKSRIGLYVRQTWPVLTSLLPLWTALLGATMTLAAVAPATVGAMLPLAGGVAAYVVGQLGLGIWLRDADPDPRLHALRWHGALLLATTIFTLAYAPIGEGDWISRTLEFVLALQGIAACVVARGIESRGEFWDLTAGICGVLLVAAAVAWVSGYYTLAGYVTLGIVLSWLTWALFTLARTVVVGILDGLDTGKGASFTWMRRQLLIAADQPLPGYTWFRLLAELLALLGIIAGLMAAWRLTRFGLPSFSSLLMDGFPIGQVNIVPVKVALGLLLFALLLAVFARTRHLLTNQLASRSRMNFATAETIATVTGYVGFVIALLVGLGAAGFKLSNLALILGALSVGIGFGLQNVVNNFVSGLILLFERPIKTGDWIRVGETDGYVTRIRVRSTEIQTLDRFEVIVPNSELIASQVTNLTLHSGLGRLIVPIGVAYGSDTEKVKEVLLAAAEAQENVLKHGSSAPRVIFKGFGDSSLDFELRCFLDDIKAYWPTLSDLNFAIDARFREAGIEIPFPQRDLHLRSTIVQPVSDPGAG